MNCHCVAPNTSRIALPTVGPRMEARPYTMPTMPRAMPRFSSGNAVPNSAVATGMMPPPPSAWMTRAPMRIQKLPKSCATPHSAEPKPKSRMHSR